MAQTYGQIVYLIMDELKLSSDDTTLNEYHLIELINKYRALLLKQKYSGLRKSVNYLNYQLFNVDMYNNSFIGLTYTNISLEKVPLLLDIGITKVFHELGYDDDVYTYVDRNRFKYVCNNKYLKTIRYASILGDNNLYIKSRDILLVEQNKAIIEAVFLDPSQPYLLIDPNVDLLEKEFPLEDTLISTLILTVVKDLQPRIIAPQDIINNENDDLNSANPKDNE